jgi:hypothetical protein
VTGLTYSFSYLLDIKEKIVLAKTTKEYGGIEV